MAKGTSKTGAKSKFVAKGEYIAMGVSGLFLALLLIWGASRWAGAQDPAKISSDLNQKAQQVHNRIATGDISAEDAEAAKQPDWVAKTSEYKAARIDDFKITGPQFDPIAKPDTKRENPRVLPIGAYQIDLTRAPMKAYDITYDNEGRAKIGVIVSKIVGEVDKALRKNLGKNLEKRGNAGGAAAKQNNQNPMGMGGQPGIPMGGMPIGGMPMGGMPMGGRGSGGASNPYGLPGGFDASAQRTDKAIEYVALDQLDKAIGQGKLPATTVIPLRMITIHAEIPYKKQVEEIKRAMRLATYAEATKWGPIYDGYEIQRKVTRVQLNGKVETITDWADYKFEDKYVELINSRKLSDSVEDGYLSHFLRYDMSLALPLPQLVEELGVSYPDITLPSINATIKKLKDKGKQPVTPSDVVQRVQGSRADIYRPQHGGASGTGADGLLGAGVAGGLQIGGDRPMGMGQPPAVPPMGQPPAGGPRLGDASTAANAPPVEIEHLLLRFIDVAVEPGYTYEYRVRLKMLNPNFKRDAEVSNPAFALVEKIPSLWTPIAAITVPNEAFLFAIDPAGFRAKLEKEYPDPKDNKDTDNLKNKELRDRLKPRDDQAVVEMCTWMEQVRTDTGGKREPVGGWVVVDVPVGRGEFVGRKQYVKLPVWSSETNQYILRDVADKILTTKVGGKDVTQPKGWLVDFTTKSVLVDFEGGKVKTKIGNKEVIEDVATELLIVRDDNKLIVKSSATDEANENRKDIVGKWEAWIKTVEARKAPAGKDDFERKKD